MEPKSELRTTALSASAGQIGIKIAFTSDVCILV